MFTSRCPTGLPTAAIPFLLGEPRPQTNSASPFATDANGDDFTSVVVLSGFSTYLLGDTGAAGDIFFTK